MRSRPTFLLFVLCCLGVVGVTALHPLPVAAQEDESGRQQGELFPNLGNLQRVQRWKLTFAYAIDYDRQFAEGDLSNQTTGHVESSGEAEFVRVGEGSFEAARGNARYQYRSAQDTEGKLFTEQPFKSGMVSEDEGSGTAIIDRTSTLEFDPERMTYSFAVYPGGSEGVEVRSRYEMTPGAKESIDKLSEVPTGVPNYTDLVKEETDRVTQELEKTLPSPEMQEWGAAMRKLADIGSWFKDQGSGDGRVPLIIEVQEFPLPFFGTVLAGTTTDYPGAVISWRLEPLAEERAAEDPAPSECWTHYHPRDADTRQEVVSLGEELAPSLGRAREEARKRRLVLPQGGGEPVVYLFEHGARDPTRPAVCGDSLVGVPVTEGPLQQLAPPDPAPSPAAGLYTLPGGADSPDRSGELQALLQHLFFTVSLPDEERKLFNPLEPYLWLHLTGAHLEGGQAVVQLQGEFEERRPCDRERIAAQLTETVLQAGLASRVSILLNDRPF